ncbi:ubiquitin-specific protease ubp2 [Lunasporangiospora selenospora]|uniref:Ubiquitin carboxyl-terminal hydrolase n=1 Tax=Lunasporangiospora selenospora TaxID=979761 RepID=A0A9P6FYK7_9FUNG|nr:ubiquitin-specific protease ubp2 [Lunasporangiospora selenospora]
MGGLYSCSGMLHHLHTRFDSETVVAECCRCGLVINAIKEEPTIPRSMIYRLTKSRRPKSNNPTTPHIHDTFEVLIRILSEAIDSDTRSVNTKSKLFAGKIGHDDASIELLKFARFTLDQDRYIPPEPNAESAQHLTRCFFQLQLALSQEKAVQTPAPLQHAFGSLLDKLGGAQYMSGAQKKKMDFTKRPSLLSERDVIHGKLGCISDMSDEVIIDAFRTQVGHDNLAASTHMDVLEEIQKHRKSDALSVEIACQRSEGFVSTTELKRAYRAFEIPDLGEALGNDVLVGLIKGSLGSGTKEDLKVISRHRGIYELEQLLLDLSPSEDQTQDDVALDFYYAQMPVGLSNIGNTCYLNSLLQYMYTVREIRKTILDLESHVEDESDDAWNGKVIDGRALTRQDVTEAKELAIELKKLFIEMQTAKKRSVRPSSRLVELLLTTNSDPSATNLGKPRAPDDFFEQQDVSETLSILVHRLGAAFKRVPKEDASEPIDRFESLFYVKAVQKRDDLNESTGQREERRIVEDFSTLILPVTEPISMEELMDDYFYLEAPLLSATPLKQHFNISSDGPPGDEGRGGTAVSDPGSSNQGIVQDSSSVNSQDRDITVTELPPILHVHLLRTQYDRAGSTSFKSQAMINIPKRLFLDQYLESYQGGNQERVKRAKILKSKRRKCRKSLEESRRKHSAVSAALNSGAESAFMDEGVAISEPSDPGTETSAKHDTRENEIESSDNIPWSPTPADTAVDQPDFEPLSEECANEAALDKSSDIQIEAEQPRLDEPQTRRVITTFEGGLSEQEHQEKIKALTEAIQKELGDARSEEYKLHAVFHHEGGSNFGHYWVYIYDDQSSSEPRWLKFSDDIVSEIGLAREGEVFDGTMGSTSCFCIYVRAGKPDLVQTVSRLISGVGQGQE